MSSKGFWSHPSKIYFLKLFQEARVIRPLSAVNHDITIRADEWQFGPSGLSNM